ncbi:MAG: acyl-CoA dehydrogenase family protein, partial [Mycobacterium sp.]
MTTTIADEQFAARELVRDWAAGTDSPAAVREIEQGAPDAWRPVFAGLAELGLFGVAVSDDAGGAGGSVEDLCAMVEEAARALIPGPVATTALATLVVTDPAVLEGLSSGAVTAGLALTADLREESGRVTGSVDYALGADASGVLLVPVDDHVLLVDLTESAVGLEPLPATDFSRPLARVMLDGARATRLEVSRRRFDDLAATVLAAEAAGIARWTLDTAAEYAKVREQFGKPIGSFQAVKHMCAEMLLRYQQIAVAARDAAAAAAGDDDDQLTIAAA